MKQKKLELTWIGKDEEIKLEPRILIEDPSKSYGDKNTENMLIHGDNLLALKALESEFTGKIKCIYIDPPFNTGNAFEHYDDNVEHSIWLTLMQQRLKLLKKLLAKDGSIIVHLDDQEAHYLKVVMDEIFGRSNFIATITVRSSTPSGLKTTHKDKTLIKQKDLLLVYKSSDELRIYPQFIKRDKWDVHYSRYFNFEKGKIENLLDVLIENKIVEKGAKLDELQISNPKFYSFYIAHKNNIFQTQPVMPDEHKKASINKKGEIYEYLNSEGGKEYALNGRRFVFLSSSLKILEDGKEDLGVLLCDFWTDIDFQNTQNEGNISFPAGKKPEALIKRVLDLFTQPGDIVLDSFLGSGTTVAVAHKMKRNWVGIELGDHVYSHCLPRLKSVIIGTDESGVSSIVNWKGGGGFKFYELASSLLNKDKHGNWIISKEYRPEMLAAAMAKQEGFKYHPDPDIYWKQGQSTEKDFIFTTTNFITVEMLDKIHEEMKSDESLLICCKSYKEACDGLYPNISIKKIPNMLLGRCEFGKDDYSLNIVNLPSFEEVVEAEEELTKEVKKKKLPQDTLFPEK